MDDLFELLFMIAMIEAVDNMTDEEVKDALLSDGCDCTKCPAAGSCEHKASMYEKRQELQLERKLQDIPPDMDMHWGDGMRH